MARLVRHAIREDRSPAGLLFPPRHHGFSGFHSPRKMKEPGSTARAAAPRPSGGKRGEERNAGLVFLRHAAYLAALYTDEDGA